MTITDEKLEKPEVSETRSFVKAWNRVATQKRLPRLLFDENPDTRHDATPKTVLFAGKKPVILSLLPPIGNTRDASC